MKSHLINVALVVLIFITACKTAKIPTEKVQDLNKKVESKDFTVEVKYASPSNGGHINLSYGYDLRIKNDSAYAYLPYYGIAYSAPYNGDGGIKFEELMADYTCVKTKKLDGWDIHFKVKSKENSYDIRLNMFENGNTTISVNSYNRQSITFYGELKE
ncbi:MAG: DUF4251 domain-containing protein [Paludibacter sp.]